MASVADDPSLEAILRRWREAGHPLGNHTYSYANLSIAQAAASKVRPRAG
jgi:hypothetical protein